MRTRDVMSSPVITLSPNTRLKEVATTLIEHGINAVPVVDDGRLVGIVSEADLLTLEEELDAIRRLPVAVAGGVVTIDPAASPLGRQLLEGLARTVPGVVEVRAGKPVTDGLEPAGRDRR